MKSAYCREQNMKVGEKWSRYSERDKQNERTTMGLSTLYYTMTIAAYIIKVTQLPVHDAPIVWVYSHLFC